MPPVQIPDPVTGITIDNAFIKTFEALAIHEAQQQDARLRPFVMERSTATKQHSFPLLGTLNFGPKTRRAPAGGTPPGSLHDSTSTNPTPFTEVQVANRVAITKPYDCGTGIEDEEDIRTLISPKSEYPRIVGWAANRQIDDLLIGAATADALDDEQVATPFPPQNIIGTGTAEFSFGMLTTALRSFLEQEVDQAERKIVVVGPKQAQLLLHMTQATSADFVYVRALADKGYVDNWMGCTWVVHNRLLHPGNDPTKLDCLMFTRKAMGLLVNRDLRVRIGQDVGNKWMTRIYGDLDMGAVRVNDPHIRVLRVKDSASV